MTQPAVTFQIKQLEEHFNTRLFERGHGRIALTPAGDIVGSTTPSAFSALSAELDTRLKEMTGQVAGLLLVGASTTIAEFLLPQVLGDFKSGLPRRGAAPVRRQLGRGREPGGGAYAGHRLHRGATRTCARWRPTCAAKTSWWSCARPRIRWRSDKRSRSKQLLEYSVHQPRVGLGHARGHRRLLPEGRRAARIAQRGDGARQPRGAQGAGGHRPRLHHHVARRGAKGDPHSASWCSLPLAPRLIRNLSVVYPKEKFRSQAGQHLRPVRQGKAGGHQCAG